MGCRRPCCKPTRVHPCHQRCSSSHCPELSGTWEAVGETKNSAGVLKTHKKLVLCTTPLQDGSGDAFVNGYEQFTVLSGGTGHDAGGSPTLSDKEYISGVYLAKTKEIQMVETAENGFYTGTLYCNDSMTLIFLQAGTKHVVGILKLRKLSSDTEGC